MQNERGTQHGTSRRTPLPLFRAVSIFCLSVAIFSTSLRVGFGHSLPPCARVIRQDGAADKRRLRLAVWGARPRTATPVQSVTRQRPPAAARRASPPPAPPSRSTTRTRWRPDRPASRGHPPRAHRDAAPPPGRACWGRDDV